MMSETVEPRRTDSSSRTDVAAAEAPKPGLELIIGSNIFRNTNGVVKIHGKEQLVFELRSEQGLLLVTIDLYSEAGVHIAHVRRNVLALNQGGQFTIDIHRAEDALPGDIPWLRLLGQHSGDPVLEACVLSENKI